MTHRWLPLALLALALGAGLAALAAAPPEGAFAERLRWLEKPLPVPDYVFQEQLADGSQREWGMLEFRGRVVVLNFWATWCSICAKELPKLDELAASLRGEPIEVLALSLDDSLGEAAAALAKRGHHNLRALHDRKSVLSTVLGVRGVPTTFVVGPDGRAIAAVQGPADWNSEAALEWLRSLAGR